MDPSRPLSNPFPRGSHLRYSRWDGGPIEVAKGILTGWRGFNPCDPDLLHATANWYNPRTIALARAMGFNWLWLTWSVGFSPDTERGHQELVRRYVRECHRHGIRVTAYLCLSSIFTEDMFEKIPASRNWVALDAKGHPFPYKKASFFKARVGRVTRVIACYAAPGWRRLVRRRVAQALDAGVDALDFDNTLGVPCRRPETLRLERRWRTLPPATRMRHGNDFYRWLAADFHRDILRHARRVRPGVLFQTNCAPNVMAESGTGGAITLERGDEPGVFSGPVRRTREGSIALEAGHRPIPLGKGRRLTTNLGILAFFDALRTPGQPLAIEYGGRQTQSRMERPLHLPSLRVALAECAAFDATYEHYVEGQVLSDLFHGRETARAWGRELARAHRFFARLHPMFRLSVPWDSRELPVTGSAEDVAKLTRLFARGIPCCARFPWQPARESPAPRRVTLRAGPWVLMRSATQPSSGTRLLHLINYHHAHPATSTLEFHNAPRAVEWVCWDLPRPRRISLERRHDRRAILRLPSFETWALVRWQDS